MRWSSQCVVIATVVVLGIAIVHRLTSTASIKIQASEIEPLRPSPLRLTPVTKVEEKVRVDVPVAEVIGMESTVQSPDKGVTGKGEGDVEIVWTTINSLLGASLDTEDDEVFRKLEELRASREKNAASLRAIWESSPSEKLREVALWLLVNLQDPKSRGIFSDVVTDEDESEPLRLIAAEGLLSTDPIEAVKVFSAVMERTSDSGLRVFLAKDLAKVPATSESQDAMRSAFRRATNSTEKLSILYAIASLPSPTRKGFLKDIVVSGEHEMSLRRAAIENLAILATQEWNPDLELFSGLAVDPMIPEPLREAAALAVQAISPREISR